MGGDGNSKAGSAKSRRGVYNRRGGGTISIEDESNILKLLSDRYHAKQQRNYSAADEIRDELMHRYNVSIDDRSNEWRIDTDEYARKAGYENDDGLQNKKILSEDDVKYIESSLKERFALKRDRMYDDADAIREDLRGRFGVAIDDRTKEWFVEVA